MRKVNFIIFTALVLIIAALYLETGQCLAQSQAPVQLTKSHDINAIIERKNNRITHEDRAAAAERAAAKGMFPATSRRVATIKAGATKAAAIEAQAAVQMAIPGTAPHYFGPYPNYANSPLPIVDPASGAVSGGIRKFIDGLPGLTAAGANNLGQYIPIAAADINSYQGSDYYEIAVVQYREKMHTDLPATLLRGYVQIETPQNAAMSSHVALTNANLDGTSTPITLNGQQVYAVDKPHYLGPLISATRNRPVRILFRNLLPAGVAGDLFIPVDTTVMGSGMGPDMGGMQDADPQNPMCGMTPKPAGCFPENRATLHLHGGINPWISDGTPHQWVTPANENTPYPEGVSVHNVPDMPDPGPGALTFFYTNQQSARLMFYHDHAWGITRLNVYAGEAAAYLITEPMEQNLINQGLIPAEQIPLVIQDKTFVPSMEQLATEDPTWDVSRWGGFGQLWVPHVYVPAQNPGDSSGVNQFGRWAYGPWFWPPTLNIDHPPVPNPYYDPNCDPDVMWCEPPTIPGAPFVSMGMEAFNDTPVVNGTVYPTVTLEPKPYRFRILSVANDRFFNLQLYVADSTGTEVVLNAAEVGAALSDPAGVFPTPDPALSPAGPDWIQIGTEGGFLPAPVVIPPQPITWVTDPTVFNAGNVDRHSLLLGPAERADVIVDFSAFAGKTLILYNDAPAAFPARDPRYDYYTGNADLTSTGGAPSTLPGYGPNTRTIMQINVAAAPVSPSFNLDALQTAFKSASQGGLGVFENTQNPIIVGQGAYNPAYGSSFMSNGARAGLVQIFDTQLTFNTLLNQGTTNLLTMPLQRKAIQDEMGEAFDKEYGRMSGNLGLEAAQAQGGLQQNLILYPYINPASEILDGLELPMGAIDVGPIASADDGTQMWKITHNGVDTHPIHFHLYDVQLINRVGWDGIIRRPDANELGWKDTVRISPLEDTIVAFRPVIPKIPFGVLDSIRPLNPMMPLGSTTMFVNMDANADPINPPISNELTNFGWEYVWHCHILSHEEMDMMRPVSVSVSRALPAASVLNAAAGNSIVLSWNDRTPINYVDLTTWGNPASEVGYEIERAVAVNGVIGPYSIIGTALANTTSYTDTTVVGGVTYSYRVIAYNAAGDSTSNAVTIKYTCPQNGSIGITGGQTLVGNPINLTSIVTTANTANMMYTVTESGGSCDVNPAGTYIDAENFTNTIAQGTASFVQESTQAGYLGTGYLRSIGPASKGGGSCPATDSGKAYAVNFPAAGTYKVWIRGYAFGSSSDSVFIGLDGACTGSLSSGGTASYLKWMWTSSIKNGVNTVTVPSAGLHTLNIWIRESGYLIDGIYVTQGVETPTDAVHGTTVNPNNCSAVLFTGNQAAAQSVNTTAWNPGLKTLNITANDAVCGTPLVPATGSFSFAGAPPAPNDTLTVTNNTQIAAANPADGSTGIVMQRLQVDSNNAGNGQVELVTLNLVDNGTATGIANAKIYISATVSVTLPVNAVMIGSTGLWNGGAATIALTGGAAADRTVINGVSKYIYIIYDLAAGQTGKTVQSSVTSIGVAPPDTAAGYTGSSKLLTIQACAQTGNVGITPQQTLLGNPINLTSIVTAANTANMMYAVRESGGLCSVSPTGTYIDAENFTNTIAKGTASFVQESTQAGYLGAGYLRSSGPASNGNGSCPATDSGKAYAVNFPAAGTYKVWIRGYAFNSASDSVFIGLDGACTGSLSSGGTASYLKWMWTSSIKNGVNTVTVPSAGLHTLNIWIRESGYLIDGIYVTQGVETPTDAVHGTTVNPNNCSAVLFTGNQAAAQSVNTTAWNPGLKTLDITANDAVCGTPLVPATGSFSFIP